MELPHDLKDYRAPLGAFQVVTSEHACAIVCWLLVMVLVFRDYLR